MGCGRAHRHIIEQEGPEAPRKGDRIEIHSSEVSRVGQQGDELALQQDAQSVVVEIEKMGQVIVLVGFESRREGTVPIPIEGKGPIAEDVGLQRPFQTGFGLALEIVVGRVSGLGLQRELDHVRARCGSDGIIEVIGLPGIHIRRHERDSGIGSF